MDRSVLAQSAVVQACLALGSNHSCRDRCFARWHSMASSALVPVLPVLPTPDASDAGGEALHREAPHREALHREALAAAKKEPAPLSLAPGSSQRRRCLARVQFRRLDAQRLVFLNGDPYSNGKTKRSCPETNTSAHRQLLRILQPHGRALPTNAPARSPRHSETALLSPSAIDSPRARLYKTPWGSSSNP